MEQDFITEDFAIDNAGKADWAVSVIKSEQAQCEEYISACKYQIDQLNDKINSRKEKLEIQTSYLTALLKEYLKTAPTKKAKASESLELPSGKIRLTYASKKLVPDSENLTEKYKDTEYVETQYKFKWGEFKKSLTIVEDMVINKDTGEQVEGVEIIEEEERLKVE